MATLLRFRALLLVALLVPLAYVARGHGALPVHYTNTRVTDRYDVAACGPVRRVTTALGGREGKATILCLLNFERRAHDLPGLTESQLLDRAAERHSADMVARRFFEHETPDGVSPQDRIVATGYVAQPNGLTGENIAWGEGPLASPAAIMDGWMHSPHHRDNILRPGFREVGIGIVLGGAPSTKAVHDRVGTYTNDFGG